MKITNIISIFALVALLSFPYMFVSAQENTTTSNTETGSQTSSVEPTTTEPIPTNRPTQNPERYNSLIQKAEDRKANITEKREEIRENVTDRVQNFVSNNIQRFLDAMSRVYQRTLVLFSNFDTRIEGKITDLKNNGVDTVNVENALESAQNKVNELEVFVENKKTEVKSKQEAGTLEKDEIRIIFQEIKTYLDSAKSAYRNVIDEMKNTIENQN